MSEEEGEIIEPIGSSGHGEVSEIGSLHRSVSSYMQQRRRDVKSRLGGYSPDAKSSEREHSVRHRLGHVYDSSTSSAWGKPNVASREDNVTGVAKDVHQCRRPVKERLGSKRHRSTERNENILVSTIPRDINNFCESKRGYYEFEKIARKSKCILPYKKLQNLTKKNPLELVTFLASSSSGFPDKLVSKLDSDWIQLLVEVLAIACSVDFNENKTIILSQANEMGFLSQVEAHVMELPLQIEEITFSNAVKLLQNLSKFFKTSVNLLPNKACETLDSLVAKTMKVVTLLEKLGWEFPDSLKECFTNVKQQLNDFNAEKEVKCQTGSVERVICKNSPPNNFRDISVFPTLDDIVNKRPFLRPNIVKGSYENENHYLDVQYRLLREDFVGPLRDGIMEFMGRMNEKSNDKRRRINNIRTYQNVVFRQIIIHKGVVCFVVSLEGKNVRMGKKRLMFGSLLCFSADSFKNIFFGTVLDRQGSQLMVELKNVTDTADIFEKKFVMVESEVYFEPYYHVLTALQNMTNAFPMKKYIIGVQNESSRPGYIQENTQFVIGEHTVTLLYDGTWPSAAQLQLNDSQYAAFKSALTRELVVIQGPPGTGKTFLGLKIAKALLANSSVWNTESRPILVVCYTNHALDQFLEGLLAFTDRIVRVGGQSRNETLRNFHLKVRRKDVKCYSSVIYEKCRNLEALMRKMKEIEVILAKIYENKGLVSLAWFVKVGIWKPGYVESMNLNDSLLIEWLAPDLQVVTQQLSCLQAQISGDYSQIREESSSSHHWQKAAQTEMQDEGIVYDPFHCEPDDDLILDPLNVEIQDYLAIDLDDLNKRLDCVNIIFKKASRGSSNFSSQRLLKLQWLCQEFGNAIRALSFNLRKEWLHDGVDVQQSGRSIWELSMPERWKLYNKWITTLTVYLHKTLRQCQYQIHQETKLMEEARSMKDLEVMKLCLVVGMTTTGAARLQTLLGALKPKIVIVEEAAEVMECHLTVSLTEQCQHLIMIGDHQQLRPKTAVYRLSKDYNFDVSLFERMLLNGMNSVVLNIQHRMRPEIASLVTPIIYPELFNHESVMSLENIKGVSKNLFFITHSHPEEEARDIESHVNIHEALFLLSLARYFVYQGYSPEQITLLCTYSGQMFKAQDLCKEEYGNTLQNLKIVVVDNYQGEENDIVLLSIVRSNEEAKIGFLKTENRVCVALSRARRGLFIIGNMDNLVKSSDIWPKVKGTLEAQGAVGTHLELRCEVHPDKLTHVASHEDFHQVPDGGCNLPCGTVLSCGHTCSRICHITNRNHAKYKCREPCSRNICVLMHQCPLQCWQQCEKCKVEVLRVLPCGHTRTLLCHIDHITYLCQTKVTRELHCGHKIDLQCHVNYTNYACEVQVLKDLPCGHQATLMCSVDALTHKCMAKVSKKPPCGHQQEIECHVDPEVFKCSVNVEVTLPDCGHDAIKLCLEDIAVTQLRCKSTCDIRLPCGHSCVLKCHTSADPEHLKYKCKKPCTRMYANCSMDHPCDAKCFEKCIDCPVKVTKTAANCKHKNYVHCTTPPEKIVCIFKCEKTLECGHRCQNKCYAPCGPCIVHVKKTVEECGHKVNVPCSQTPTVKMCSKKCTKKLACGHNCTQRCCDSCTVKCIEKIPSSVVPACMHTISIPCHRRGDNFSPTSVVLMGYCLQPCDVLLQCGHRCRGTCGDCLQGRVHVACREKCNRILICGHQCSSPCSTSCPPCDKPCNMYRCKHSKCNRSCGVVCYPCKERCEWSCQHLRCSRRCNDLCDREPCQQPCLKKLECGHLCIGFCGEICPPLCRECNFQQVTDIFFGYEDEKNARFVLLEDCGHVFESRGLEKWMKQTDGAIMLKVCPKCRSPITRTQRFMNFVKKVYRDITCVKKKLLGDEKIVAEQQAILVNQVCSIHGDEYLAGSRYYGELVRKLLDALEINTRRCLSTMEVDCLRVLVEIVQDLADTCMAVLKNLNDISKENLITSLNVLLRTILYRGKKISEQEVEDIKLELMRFHRFSQLLVLESEPQFLIAGSSNANINAAHMKASKIVSCIEKYSSEQDSEMKAALEKLKTALKSAAVLTDKERQEIVAAIGMKQGHWFKCPNGHPYVVTECGGVMQIGKCNECGASIGGQQHRILSDNRLASEMDGASRPAYPQ